jgi:LysM repeat protein
MTVEENSETEDRQPEMTPPSEPPESGAPPAQPPTAVAVRVDPSPLPTANPAPAADPERQTAAELFMTLPNRAKFAVLAAVGLLLIVVVALIWPRGGGGDDLAAAEGTATAVAAFLTAQPTPTPSGTDTPRMYIIEETPISSPTPELPPTPIVYVVQPGDTVNSIARRYNVTVQEIATLNGLFNVNSIAVGQELLIPTPGPGTAVPPTSPDQPTSQPGQPAPVSAFSELVIKGVDNSGSVPLRIAAGPDYQAIMELSRGTLAFIVAKTPDDQWYLIQLEDGYTRGWIPATSAGLLYPANPASIPTTPMP